jgi:hypothetical protein
VRYVGVLAGTQIAAAEQYFSNPGHDVISDGATYMLADLPLTDVEARTLRARIQKLVKRFTRPVGRNRRVRHLAVSLLPDPRQTASEA